MKPKILSFYGLKWNPFSPDQPVDALMRTQYVEHFCWQCEHLALDGGFAAIQGEAGTGKSVILRIVADYLSKQPEVQVEAMERPQSGLADFYREIGERFGVSLSPSNRWYGFKTLRERFKNHVETTLFRPVLLIDEAQLVPTPVLCELRLLGSLSFDSRSVLTVILCGDKTLAARFNEDALLPLASRIRVRLATDFAEPETLAAFLEHAHEQAGNPRLMTKNLINTLSKHSAGNFRVLTTLASQLLVAGFKKEAKQLDEQLYLETFSPPLKQRMAEKPAKKRRQR